ncbi:MAG: phage tail tube protein [Bacillota bacterium]|nr:phage tail tube protein [Bacillota bacterium]
MIKTGRNGNVRRKIDLTSAAAWATGTNYKVGDIVTNGSPTKYYYCITAHAAGAAFDVAEQANFIDVTDGFAISKLSSWKLNIKQSLIDASHFGDGGWDSSVVGTKSWSGQIDGSFNITDDPYGQKVLQDAIDSGDEIDLELYVDEDVSTEKYEGKAFIEEFDIDTQTKNLVKITIKFTGNGPLQMP